MRKFDPPNRIGFAWYDREEWLRLAKTAPDRNELDATYEDWLANAERAVKTLRSKGAVVMKVSVRIDDLLAWCTLHGHEPNSEARAKYVIDLAKTFPERWPSDD